MESHSTIAGAVKDATANQLVLNAQLKALNLTGGLAAAMRAGHIMLVPTKHVTT